SLFFLVLCLLFVFCSTSFGASASDEKNEETQTDIAMNESSPKECCDTDGGADPDISSMLSDSELRDGLDEYVYVSTPRTPNSVLGIIYYYDYNSQQINYCNTYQADYYFQIYGAIYLSTATNRYNCHSYAWHSTNTSTNNVWIPDPSNYISDHSYCCVATLQVGDIIIYCDDMDTPFIYTDDEIIHSGIVTGVLSGTSNGLCGTSDLVTVTSKWGGQARYSHNGYHCPYTEFCPLDPDDQIAEYVRYYRLSTFNYSNTGLYSGHQCTCTLCGHQDVKPHTYSYVNIDLSSGHRVTCSKCNLFEIEEHDWQTYLDGYRCSKCGVFSSYIPVIAESVVPEEEII
ncbi:MAG: hypothetical protein IJR83_01295, partial [Clostridia bacterium]|nr:hypothetical protein [Clostridia bacterium]